MGRGKKSGEWGNNGANTSLHPKEGSSISKIQSFDEDNEVTRWTMAMHYGTRPGHFETSIIHFPTSEGVSEVSERSESSGARKQENERASSQKCAWAGKCACEGANVHASEQMGAPLWSKTAKNTDCSTGPLARPFTRSLAPLTRSLASLAPSAALTHSLARSLCSLPRSWDSKLSDGYFVCVFFYYRP